jgi:hypothetical protein
MLASSDSDATDLNEKALAALSMTNARQSAHLLPAKIRAKFVFHKDK